MELSNRDWPDIDMMRGTASEISGCSKSDPLVNVKDEPRIKPEGYFQVVVEFISLQVWLSRRPVTRTKTALRKPKVQVALRLLWLRPFIEMRPWTTPTPRIRSPPIISSAPSFASSKSVGFMAMLLMRSGSSQPKNIRAAIIGKRRISMPASTVQRTRMSV